MIQFFNKKMSKKRKGFTLIELVVVIAILGILAAIAIPRLGSQRLSAAVSAHNTNVRTIQSAAAIYLAENAVAVDTDFMDEIVAANLLNGPPDVPSAISGQTVTNSDGTSTLAIDAAYTVTVDTDNNIVVKSGPIEFNGPYKVVATT